jgi:hypothetical protein
MPAPEDRPWSDIIRVWFIVTNLQVFFEIKLSHLFVRGCGGKESSKLWLSKATNRKDFCIPALYAVPKIVCLREAFHPQSCFLSECQRTEHSGMLWM